MESKIVSNRREIDKSLASIAKGAGIIMFGMIMGKIIGTVNQIILARVLGPDDFGLLNLGFSLFSIFSIIGMFGMKGGIARYVSINNVSGDNNRLRATIQFGLLFNLTISSIIGAFLYFNAGFISEELFNKSELKEIIKLFSIALPFHVLIIIMNSIMRGVKEAKYTVYGQEVGRQILKVVIFLGFIGIGILLSGALYAYLLATVFTFLYMLYIVNTRVTRVFHFPRSKTSVWKEILTYSWPLTFSSFFLVAMNQIDRIILGFYRTSDDIGIYTAAHGVAYLLGFILKSFGFIFFPIISELFSKNDTGTIQRVYTSVTKWIFMINFPIFLMMVLLPKFFLNLLYGSQYESGNVALQILACGVIINTSVGLVGVVLNGVGRTKLTLTADVIGGLSNVVLNFMLIPNYGILGAAAATSFSLALRNILSLIFIRAVVKIIPYNRSFIKIGLFDLTFGLVIYLLFILVNNHLDFELSFSSYNIDGNVLITTFLVIFYTVICYFSYIKFRWLDDYDLSIIRRVKQRIPIGDRFFRLKFN